MAVVNVGAVADQNKALVLWDNYLTRSNAVITADGSSVGFPPINVSDPATYNSWKAPVVGSARLYFDLGEVRGVNTIGIAAHNMATIGSSVQVLVSDNGTTWSAITLYAPTTNEDIIISFVGQQRRYVSLNFFGAAPAIGVVFVGARLSFPSTPVVGYTPTHHARRYTKFFNSSITGNFLGNRVMGAGGSTEVTFPSIPRDFVDGPIRGFENHYNRGGTFFYAGMPGSKPQDMAYCRASSEDGIVAVSYVYGDKLADLSFGIETYVGV